MAEILLSESYVTSTDFEKSDGANPGTGGTRRGLFFSPRSGRQRKAWGVSPRFEIRK